MITRIIFIHIIVFTRYIKNAGNLHECQVPDVKSETKKTDFYLENRDLNSRKPKASVERTRKRLVVTANRREGVYNRTGEPSVTFV